MPDRTSDTRRIRSERNLLLKRFENFFEAPMIVLGFAWLALLVIELAYKTSPALETLGVAIWIIFIVDFILKLVLAPQKLKFIRSNMLTLISLIVPALRIASIFRFLRILRFSRSFRLVKVLGSLNRGMRALAATMQRRAFGYALLLTLIILFVSAAGMYAFERDIEGGLSTYGSSLWWTFMILTTMGSDYWPQTPEGRILCIVLALYAFAVFGYVTATIATFFIERDAEDNRAEIAGTKQIEELRKEIMELKELIKDRRE